MLDDFLIRPISPDAASDTLEVIEDRHGLRSTILTSLSFMDRANGLIITGPTGVGKTTLAARLAWRRSGKSTRYAMCGPPISSSVSLSPELMGATGV